MILSLVGASEQADLKCAGMIPVVMRGHAWEKNMGPVVQQ